MQNQNEDVLGDEEEEEEEGEDIEEVEEAVGEMAQQILDFRNSFSDLLQTTLASLLHSQMPILPPIPINHFGRSCGSASETSLTEEEDQENIKKFELLKQKISSNATAIPATLKRMRECMDHIDKLQSHNGVIHPAFKKKRETH